MMKLKPFRDEAPEDLLGVGALGDVLDVGDVRVVDVLADVLESLVVGLAPAAVVMRPDEDHRDVELSGLDVRDLEVRAALGAGARAGAPTAARAPRSRPGVAAARPEHEHSDRQQGEQPDLLRRHGSSSSTTSRTRRLGPRAASDGANHCGGYPRTGPPRVPGTGRSGWKHSRRRARWSGQFGRRSRPFDLPAVGRPTVLPVPSRRCSNEPRCHRGRA